MTASLVSNKEVTKAALWWLYEGAMFIVALANTSGAASPPALDGPPDAWYTPTDYTLSNDYDIFLTGGTADYSASVADRSVLPQLVITLDYATNVTYTDLLVFVLPAIDPGASAPIYAFPQVAVIHESTPISLLSTQTKTYRLDLFAELV
jgi:hypothetical protein